MTHKIKLYHWAGQDRAQRILKNGFRQSDEAADSAEIVVRDTKHALGKDVSGECLLEIETDLSEKDLNAYAENMDAKGYSEWRVPASVLDEHGKVKQFAAK